MKFQVVGSGLAGLSTAYHLSSIGEVTILDTHQSKGASSIAAGLMHPFVGFQCKLNRYGKEGLNATLALIKEIGADASILHRGVYRLCTSETMQEKCHLLSQTEKSVIWLENEEIKKLFPFTDVTSGIYIEEGYAIDTKKYLQALFRACEKRGVQKSTFLDESVDKIIYCTGAWSPGITQVKGQLLTMQWPKDLPPLTSPIVGQAYVVPCGDQVVVGSTFERGFSSEKADLEIAKDLILPKLKLLVPQLNESHILSCAASLRASAPGHMPLIKQLDKKSFLYTGLGSKGLLYHALYAKTAVETLTGFKIA